MHVDKSRLDPEMKPLTGFVWGILPGESGVVRIMNVRKGIFEGVLLKKSEVKDTWYANSQKQFQHDYWALFSVHADRIKPDCEIFGDCGGCKLRHLSYTNGLEYKKKWLQNHLVREKLSVENIELVTPPYLEYYRNHVQIHINKHEHQGFYAPYTYRTSKFPEHGCKLFFEKQLRPFFPEKFRIERVVRIRYDHLSQNFSHAAFNSSEDKSALFTYSVPWPNQENIWSITLPNTAFFQVNTQFIPHWLERIKGYLQQSQIEEPRVLELFSGFGFISRMLKPYFAHKALSADILAESEIKKVVMKNNDNNSSDTNAFLANYIRADLNDLAGIPETQRERMRTFQPEIMLLNPARAGFTPENIRVLLSEILEKKPELIVYSSCNPATFCRDLKAFAEYGYAFDKIVILDFFPYTSHFEVMTKLQLRV